MTTDRLWKLVSGDSVLLAATEAEVKKEWEDIAGADPLRQFLQDPAGDNWAMSMITGLWYLVTWGPPPLRVARPRSESAKLRWHLWGTPGRSRCGKYHDFEIMPDGEVPDLTPTCGKCHHVALQTGQPRARKPVHQVLPTL